MFSSDAIKKIKDAEDAWRERIAREGLDRQRLSEFQTSSGIPVKLVYTPADVGDMDYLRDLSFPGDYPFTRGVYPTMYRGRIWTMRQYSGYATAEESNKRYKYLLEQGQTGLSVAFDLPTQCGYDSDHPIAYAEVGRIGVTVDQVRENSGFELKIPEKVEVEPEPSSQELEILRTLDPYGVVLKK